MEYISRLRYSSADNTDNLFQDGILIDELNSVLGITHTYQKISIGRYALQFFPIEFVGGYNKAAIFVGKADVPNNVFRVEVLENDINRWDIFAYDINNNPIDINGYIYVHVEYY